MKLDAWNFGATPALRKMVCIYYIIHSHNRRSLGNYLATWRPRNKQTGTIKITLYSCLAAFPPLVALLPDYEVADMDFFRSPTFCHGYRTAETPANEVRTANGPRNYYEWSRCLPHRISSVANEEVRESAEARPAKG